MFHNRSHHIARSILCVHQKQQKKTTLVPVSVPVFLPSLLSIQFRRVRIFKTLKYPSDRAFARKKVESTFANLNSAKQKRKTEKRNSQPSRKKGKMKKQKRQKDKVQQGYARLRLPRGRWFCRRRHSYWKVAPTQSYL